MELMCTDSVLTGRDHRPEPPYPDPHRLPARTQEATQKDPQNHQEILQGPSTASRCQRGRQGPEEGRARVVSFGREYYAGGRLEPYAALGRGV
jgi:hypothetical protein